MKTITPDLAKAEPVYIEMPGWGDDITAVRQLRKLPRNAQNYIVMCLQTQNVKLQKNIFYNLKKMVIVSF